MKDQKDYDKLIAAIGECFDHEYGDTVLEYLEYITKRNGIDANDPNPHQAVYRCAQEALLLTIKNKLEEYKQL
ncbi:hypothetical protein V5T82_14170 [Magnetovibrio sp. PR-2]|uniref:hypothetical protein n=1 Tax=Magnetovibrio sp. PR-2 TaxID=3120356 RepID=UPI002FCE180A